MSRFKLSYIPNHLNIEILKIFEYDEDKVLFPLVDYESFIINEKISTRGLVVCHDQNHGYVKLGQSEKTNQSWYSMDINPNTDADYIGNASSENDMEYFPNEYFDIIYPEYCFVPEYPKILKLIYRILKPNGLIYITGLFQTSGLSFTNLLSIPEVLLIFDRPISSDEIINSRTLSQLHNELRKNFRNNIINKDILKAHTLIKLFIKSLGYINLITKNINEY